MQLSANSTSFAENMWRQALERIHVRYLVPGTEQGAQVSPAGYEAWW